MKDEEILERLMDEHGHYIQNLCAMLLGDAHIAQEAAQDTFIKAYRGLRGFSRRNGASARTWLAHIAVNTCRDYRRSKWFRRARGCVPLETLPEVAAVTDETDRSIMEAVERLPVREREVVLLCCAQGVPAQEAARMLGVTRSTVYRRLERARALLLKGGDGDD